MRLIQSWFSMENLLKQKQPRTVEDRGMWKFDVFNIVTRLYNTLRFYLLKFIPISFLRERNEQLVKAIEKPNTSDKERNKILSRSVEIIYEDVAECVKVLYSCLILVNVNLDHATGRNHCLSS